MKSVQRKKQAEILCFEKTLCALRLDLKPSSELKAKYGRSILFS